MFNRHFILSVSTVENIKQKFFLFKEISLCFTFKTSALILYKAMISVG